MTMESEKWKVKNGKQYLSVRVLLIIMSFFLHSVNVYASDKNLPKGEAYLENFLTNTQTLEANFQQTLRTHDGEIIQQTDGQFYLNRPGKFRWNYQSPYEQIIVSDGVRIWIYDVDLQQVTVQKQTSSLPATPMSLLENSSTLHENFNVSSMDERDGVYRLKLLSKTKESDFGEIVIGVDEKGLRFMQLHDQFEQVTDIIFSDINTNKKLAKEIFKFIPPEGVDVFGG
ncbi:Outer membrane lipoprotein carrier protein LolA [hydrothermal vent metagenome]|uniref:Outer-membrane lipoprotein carrier protein n=1 Tax=hydrothermal vent metagenome TaxID=652676 RepID=A0A3B0WRF2_9ZZZZ